MAAHSSTEIPINRSPHSVTALARGVPPRLGGRGGDGRRGVAGSLERGNDGSASLIAGVWSEGGARCSSRAMGSQRRCCRRSRGSLPSHGGSARGTPGLTSGGGLSWRGRDGSGRNCRRRRALTGDSGGGPPGCGHSRRRHEGAGNWHRVGGRRHARRGLRCAGRHRSRSGNRNRSGNGCRSYDRDRCNNRNRGNNRSRGSDRRRSDHRDRGGRRRSDRSRWEQRGRIDVSVGRSRNPDPQVDIRSRPLGLSALPGDADRLPLGDRRSLHDRDLTEVGQGNRVLVELDRHRTTGGRNDTSERDRAGRRSAHWLSARPGDVDTAMLPRCIGVGTKRVGAKNVPTERPRPGGCRWDKTKRHDEHQPEHESSHVQPPVTNLDNVEDETVPSHLAVVK